MMNSFFIITIMIQVGERFGQIREKDATQSRKIDYWLVISDLVEWYSKLIDTIFFSIDIYIISIIKRECEYFHYVRYWKRILSNKFWSSFFKQI